MRVRESTVQGYCRLRKKIFLCVGWIQWWGQTTTMMSRRYSSYLVLPIELINADTNNTAIIMLLRCLVFIKRQLLITSQDMHTLHTICVVYLILIYYEGLTPFILCMIEHYMAPNVQEGTFVTTLGTAWATWDMNPAWQIQIYGWGKQSQQKEYNIMNTYYCTWMIVYAYQKTPGKR